MMIFDIFNVGHLNKEWKVFQPFYIKFSFLVKSEKGKIFYSQIIHMLSELSPDPICLL